MLFKHDRQQNQTVTQSAWGRDRVESSELIGEQVVPSDAFELAEILWHGAGMHGADRHDEAHAISGSDFAATPHMRQRDAVLCGNQLGIGRGQCVITDIVLFDPGQAVPAKGRIVVADKRLGAGVAGLCRQHCADAGRQITSACCTFREVRKRLGKAGAGGR